MYSYQFNFVSTSSVSAGEEIFVRVRPFGDTSDNCANIGTDEYNPLREEDKDGNANPYQDPSIGRFPSFVTDANVDYANSVPLNVLQNLEGRYSIIGRSLEIRSAADGLIDCCTIGYQPIPDTYNPAIAYQDLLEGTPEDIPIMPETFGIFGGFGQGDYQHHHHYPHGEKEGAC